MFYLYAARSFASAPRHICLDPTHRKEKKKRSNWMFPIL